MGAWLISAVKDIRLSARMDRIQVISATLTGVCTLLFVIHTFTNNQVLSIISIVILFSITLILALGVFFPPNVSRVSLFYIGLVAFSLFVNAFANVGDNVALRNLHHIGPRLAYIAALLSINSFGNQRISVVFGGISIVVLMVMELFVSHYNVYIFHYFGLVLILNMIGLMTLAASIGESIRIIRSQCDASMQYS